QKVRQLTGENNRWEKKISNLNKKVSFWENQDLISESLDKIKIKGEFKSYFANEVIKKDENFYNSLKENKLDEYFKSLKSNKSYLPFFGEKTKLEEVKEDDTFLNSLPPQEKKETEKDLANKYLKLFTKK
ncbi:hypothetical protein II654_00585, partial [bacterium]|nr:hypothetical protein [bacterium]